MFAFSSSFKKYEHRTILLHTDALLASSESLFNASFHPVQMKNQHIVWAFMSLVKYHQLCAIRHYKKIGNCNVALCNYRQTPLELIKTP